MAAKKEQSSYQIIGLITASVFLMLFAFTMYKLDRAGATPYKTQLKNGYATMDDSYLDPPETTHPLDALIAKRTKSQQVVVAKPEKPPQRFEFYSVLPDFQVDVPTDSDRLRRAASQTARQAYEAATTTTENQTAGRVVRVQANARQPQQSVEGLTPLFIQAGSFLDMSDARHRRAEVIMLGLNAQVESAEVQGRLYHRVKLGPYNDSGQRVQAQQRLADAGIDAIVKSR